MDSELAELLSPDQEKVVIGAAEFTVRELEHAADIPAFDNNRALQEFLLVNCVFTSSGAPAFTAEDLPELRKAARRKMTLLVRAALRVNGLLGDDNEKK